MATETRRDLDDLIAENDLGARSPSGLTSRLIVLICLAWPIYQLYVTSPLPFILGIGLIDDTQQRAIHLAFAMFLGFMLFPAFARSPRRYIPLADWLLALLAAACCLYIIAFYHEILGNAGGRRTTAETIVSIGGLLLLAELTRRTLGIALVIVAGMFSAYVFLGPQLPDLIAHRGHSLNRYIDHMWLTTEGVFGLPLGVSNSFIFLYVLFGALLDKAGAGNYFIKLSFSMLGHLRGGPAKAAVVSSGLTGLISGSAIANVVTTGTFTIPLMKRIGFSGEKAAAIEVSSSINGQIMPPVMGAAAFLMTEFVGISYFEVVLHAFVPAIISYVGLFYIVHLEAVKANMPVLDKLRESTLLQSIGRFLFGFGLVAVVAGAVYLVASGLAVIAGPAATPLAAVLLAALYVMLLKTAASQPPLETDDPEAALTTIPELRPTLLAGLHYILPIGVLVWCLMILRFSPGLAVTWAIGALAVILITQRPLMAWLRAEPSPQVHSELRAGGADLLAGMVSGSRNMIGVALAMAAAGIIVGVVSLTGLGLLMTEIIGAISGGSLMIMLLFTALMCIILGMGLPTTANYIVVASVMAGPLMTMAAQNGLIIPLFAVHLFVFYFGLISGTTPPVAVDSFAGAAVARSDPLRTSIMAFFYSLRTSVLPFIFVFNPELLLIGVNSVSHALLIIASSTVAMCLFGAATMGFFLIRSYRWESAALLLIAFTLVRPGFWLDQIDPPFTEVDPATVFDVARATPDGGRLRMTFEGENFSGDPIERVINVPLGAAEGRSGPERLEGETGMTLRLDQRSVVVEDIRFDSPAQKWGIDFGWKVIGLQKSNSRMDKEWFFVPAYLAMLLIMGLQWRRRLT
ncbi:TRAP transporter permease [Roseovarius sp. SCSIO 43702]|uniref:TRAP transporter permease n=1 Tax=Roseovarius sp. SCSIO 43702 TaxID=2823043 RepID=UPI001C734FE9|nr:TRAP transporter permease [Roseovarius sp. SCSIO 43702]QYX56856.1 TRAP transporter permease [Roseovarius sp. SCSIO 43702]